MSSTYLQYVPVLYGNGAVNELPDKIKQYGASNVLCIYDRGVASCGIGPRIVGIIRDAGLNVYAFEEALPEPPDYQIDAIYNEYKDKDIDFIVGIGGGSCMDTAKGVAFMFRYKPESIRPHVYLDLKTLNDVFPLIEIPTASGTGSEVSPVAVITDTSCSFKGGVLGRAYLAILDPELTRTAPPFITATSGMDAFSHAAEAMTSAVANPKSDVLGAYAVKNITKYLAAATENGDDMEARSKLAISSNFAGMAFSAASVHLGHALAETIGAHTHQPHGLCCALCIAPTMEYVGEYAPELIKPVAEAMEIDYTDIADDGAAIGMRVADAIRDILHACNIPSFADRGVTREEIMALVDEIVTCRHSQKCPVKITPEMAEKYLARVADSY